MSKLEDLQPNAAVRGILPDCLVTVVNVQWFGSEALELTYKTPTGQVANELVYRHDEPRMAATALPDRRRSATISPLRATRHRSADHRRSRSKSSTHTEKRNHTSRFPGRGWPRPEETEKKPPCTRLLLRRRAIRYPDRLPRSALGLAIQSRHWELVDILLEWGADPHQVSLGDLSTVTIPTSGGDFRR